MQAVFVSIDRNEDGAICRNELRDALVASGVPQTPDHEATLDAMRRIRSETSSASPAAGAAAEGLALAESLSLSLSLALKLQCSPVVPDPEPEPGAGPGFAPAPSLEPCPQVPRGGSRRGPDGGLRRVCARARDHEAEVAHEITRQR